LRLFEQDLVCRFHQERVVWPMNRKLTLPPFGKCRPDTLKEYALLATKVAWLSSNLRANPEYASLTLSLPKVATTRLLRKCKMKMARNNLVQV
jgi:hypothetical protein